MGQADNTIQDDNTIQEDNTIERQNREEVSLAYETLLVTSQDADVPFDNYSADCISGKVGSWNTKRPIPWDMP